MTCFLQLVERVEVDPGCCNEPRYASVLDDFQTEEPKIWAKKQARSRHERINRRLKQFQSFYSSFCHASSGPLLLLITSLQ
jgi:hypothetical protein